MKVREGSRSLFDLLDDTHVDITIPTAATPEPQTPGTLFQPPPAVVPEFAPMIVKITYSLRNPVDGFQFIVPTDSFPYVRIIYLLVLFPHDIIS